MINSTGYGINFLSFRGDQIQDSSLTKAVVAGARDENPTSINRRPITVTSQENLVYEKPKQLSLTTFSNEDKVSSITRQLAKQAESHLPDNRFRGGAVRLSELVAGSEKSYEQDIRQYSRYENRAQKGESPKIDLSGYVDSSTKDGNSFTLQLKTKDGDVIDFSINSYSGTGQGDDGRISAFSGLTVSYNLEGDLSKEEQAQVAVFTQNLEHLANDYFSNEDVDLSGLDLASFSSFSNVELTLDGSVESPSQQVFKLSFEDTQSQRSIEVESNGHKSNISVDKTSLDLMTSTSQGENGLQAYLEVLDKSASESRAEGSATSLMKDTFELGFSGLLEIEEDDDKPIIISNELNKNIVGLPDFDFSFDSRVDNPNKEERPREYQGFSVELSLKSYFEKSDSKDKSSLIQTQKYELEAAYYSPVGMMEKPDFDDQTYKYTQLDRSSEKTTRIDTEKGQIISAMTKESGEDNSTTLEYHKGKLVDEDVDGSSFVEVKDFTELAKQETDKQSRELLDTVMIDPYQTNSDSANINMVNLTSR